MQIPAITSALSSSAYSPVTPSTMHNNHISSLKFNKNILSEPFDILIPTFQLAHDFHTEYRNSYLIDTYSYGIVLVTNNSVLFYDYAFQLSKIIKFKSAKKFSQIQVISNLLILLSTDHQLIVIDPITATRLSSLQLSYHFTNFKKIISLNKYTEDENSIILSLHTNSSCSQLVKLNLKNKNLSIHSPLIYLQFWPIEFLSIDSEFFYFFNSTGEYQIYTLDTKSLNTLPSKIPMLIDTTYGKLRNIQRLNDTNSFIFLQENGWLIHQFTSKGKLDSLNNLQLIISSPLSSSFEKLIQILNNSYILMTDRDITLISGNHIHLIESNEKTLLDILINKQTSNLIGLFNNNTRELIDSNWSKPTQNPQSPQIPTPSDKIIYSDSNFQIIGLDNRMILQNHNGLEIGTLFDVSSDSIQIIDLNLILNFDTQFKYYLVLDSKLNFQLIVLNDSSTSILQSIKISPSKKNLKFFNVYYYEKDKILEFSDNLNNPVRLDIVELKFSTTPDNSNSSRLIVYNLFEPKFDNYNLDLISIDEIANYKGLFDQWGKWIGISDNDSTIFYKVEQHTVFESPELFLVYTIVTQDLNLTMLDTLIKEFPEILFIYVKQLTHFCTIDNSRIIETSISILYSLLLKDFQIINKLFDQCLSSGDDSLEVTILMIFCMSINETLIDKNGGKIFKNVLNYILLSNDRVCEICIDVLSKLKFENFVNGEGDSLIDFFNDFFYIRSIFFNDKEKRNFKNFQKCNDFLDSLLKQDLIDFCIIMFSIIEDPSYELENKKNVIDYVIYVILEKKEELESDKDCNTVIYLLVNSIVSFLSNPDNKYDHQLKNDDAFWENMNLLFNILSNNFNEITAINNNENDWKKVTYNDDKNKQVNICLVLDILGYIGIIYTKVGDSDWVMKPMKSSRLNITKLDKEAGNSGLNLKDINSKLKENENTFTKFRNPIFINNSKQIALINMDRLSIQIWDLENNICEFQDNLSIEVLRNDLISLKIPDFNMLMFQYIWKLRNRGKPANKEDNDRFTKMVEELHHQIVVKTQTSPSTSPLTSPQRKKSGALSMFMGFTYSELATIYEPYGEHQFGFLLEGYLSVFTDLKASDINISRLNKDQIQLMLKGNAIFVF